MFNGFDWFGNILEVREVSLHVIYCWVELTCRTDSKARAASEADEVALVCEVASVWLAVWAEAASNPDSSQASEVDSVVVCEVDSEDEVALVVLVDSNKVVDTWHKDETSATTYMPITMVLREVRLVPEVLPPSHLDYEPSLPSQTSRSSFET
jgi:hypothetical protein